MTTISLNKNVLRHVVDVHCHPTDAALSGTMISKESMDNLDITICAMSSMQSDQERVSDLASAYPDKVIPAFGYHPWFSHLILVDDSLSKEQHYRNVFLPGTHTIMKPDDHLEEAFDRLLGLLPDPRPLATIISEVRNNLSKFPNAMLGEVGLDRVFRVPYDYFAPAGQRELTPFTILLDHQLAVLEAQIELAIELQRNLSVHSVKAQQPTLELMAKLAKKYSDGWYRISVDMHSCGLSPESWKVIERKHPNVYLSQSTVINSRHPNHKLLVAACSPDRILIESDYNEVEKCTEQTLEILRVVAEVKNWEIEDEWIEDLEKDKWGAVRRLEENWKRFKMGRHQALTGEKRRAVKPDLLESDSEDQHPSFGEPAGN